LDDVGLLLKNSLEPRKPGFQPGNRANPRGRPAGTYGRRMSPLKRMLDFESNEILKRVCSEAKAGNMQAAALVLSRTLPKERLLHLAKMPKITDAATARQALSLLYEAASSGTITAGEAANLSTLAKSYAEVAELAEIKEQLAELKAQLPQQ
jgi:hypothetical protein